MRVAQLHDMQTIHRHLWQWLHKYPGKLPEEWPFWSSLRAKFTGSVFKIAQENSLCALAHLIDGQRARLQCQDCPYNTFKTCPRPYTAWSYQTSLLREGKTSPRRISFVSNLARKIRDMEVYRGQNGSYVTRQTRDAMEASRLGAIPNALPQTEQNLESGKPDPQELSSHKEDVS
jgi:hypothetical protein